MAIYLPEKLRARIDEADRGRCRYCLTAEANSGIRLTYDHITPRSRGGPTSFENVCLARSSCNEHKAAATLALDPFTGETALVEEPGDEHQAPVDGRPPGKVHGAQVRWSSKAESTRTRWAYPRGIR